VTPQSATADTVRYVCSGACSESKVWHWWQSRYKPSKREI